MPFEPLYHRLPEIAEAETRIITIPEGSPAASKLPPSDYAFMELFTEVLLPQTDSIERVKRHYRQFRATVDRPRSPLLRRRRTGG